MEIKCPIVILHGVQDESIDYKRSLDLMHSVGTDKVDLIFRKDASHRMSREQDLKLMAKHLDQLIEE